MFRSPNLSFWTCQCFIGNYSWVTICCTATLLEFLSKSRFQCLVMVQTSKETGITTGRRIAMLEHLGRLVSTVQSLKHRSSTTLPRKARLDCICDITVAVAQYLLVTDCWVFLSSIMDFLKGLPFKWYLCMHLSSSLEPLKPEDVSHMVYLWSGKLSIVLKKNLPSFWQPPKLCSKWGK